MALPGRLLRPHRSAAASQARRDQLGGGPLRTRPGRPRSSGHGIDSSANLLRYASEADEAGTYALADDAARPFPDCWFDLALAYNSLQVVTDMVGTVREAARVLANDGRFCAVVSHPLADVGRFVDDAPEAPFIIREDFFTNRRVDDTVKRDGLEMTFRGWAYSLEDYALAFERAGVRIETMREPRPARASSRYQRWSRVPMFPL